MRLASRTPISGKTTTPDTIAAAHPASFAQDKGEQKAVFITGASAGIGQNMAETLPPRECYFVSTGAFRQAVIDELSARYSAKGVRLDGLRTGVAPQSAPGAFHRLVCATHRAKIHSKGPQLAIQVCSFHSDTMRELADFAIAKCQLLLKICALKLLTGLAQR